MQRNFWKLKSVFIVHHTLWSQKIKGNLTTHDMTPLILNRNVLFKSSESSFSQQMAPSLLICSVNLSFKKIVALLHTIQNSFFMIRTSLHRHQSSTWICVSISIDLYSVQQWEWQRESDNWLNLWAACGCSRDLYSWRRMTFSTLETVCVLRSNKWRWHRKKMVDLMDVRGL